MKMNVWPESDMAPANSLPCDARGRGVSISRNRAGSKTGRPRVQGTRSNREMGKKKKDKLSVAQEIDGMEEKVALCKCNLDILELKLRKMEPTDEGRKSLEKEKSSLSSRLSHYERELKSLRHENRKNMLLSVAIFLLFALGYYCWTL